MARAVISCDSSIPVNSVKLPKRMAMNLTISETVTEYNIKELTEIFNRGSTLYPGANYITKKDG